MGSKLREPHNLRRGRSFGKSWLRFFQSMKSAPVGHFRASSGMLTIRFSMSDSATWTRSVSSHFRRCCAKSVREARDSHAAVFEWKFLGPRALRGRRRIHASRRGDTFCVAVLRREVKLHGESMTLGRLALPVSIFL